MAIATIYYIIVLFSFVHCKVNISQIKPLSPYVNYYEPVFFEPPSAAQVEVSKGTSLSVKFRAFGKKFKLLLTQGSEVLSAKAQIVVQEYNRSQVLSVANFLQNLVQGSVEGSNGSFVHGHLIDGTFDGIIGLSDDTLYVESADNFFDPSPFFKSVIYRASDLNTSAVYCKNNVTGCQGFHLGYLNPQKIDENPPNVAIHHQYSGVDNGKPRKQVCTLKIVADHTFFNFAADHTLEKTIYEMTVLIAEADKIFTREDFNMNHSPDNIGFQIMHIKIWKSPNEANYNNYAEDVTADEFLKAFSLEDFDDVCLAIAFVYRQFPHNVLGLAYTAIPSPVAIGGICARRTRMGSFNTGVITVASRSGRNPRPMSVITLAHEMGHSFGANHDPERGPCAPSDRHGGRYIMAAYAVTGKRQNNQHFSTCSKNEISAVLEKKSVCFTTLAILGETVCGNAIRENEEECDCGTSQQCDEIDRCCVPQGGTNGNTECNIRYSEGAECSHRESPCCTSRCRIRPYEESYNCYEGNECIEPGFCSGHSDKCPEKKIKRDGTSCRRDLGKCVAGICQNSACTDHNLDDCECFEHQYACHVCCSRGGMCQPATHFGIRPRGNKIFMKLDGEPCKEGRGTCFDEKCTIAGQQYPKITDTGDTYDTLDDNIENDGSKLIIGLIVCISVIIAIIFVLGMLWMLKPFTSWVGAAISKA